MEKDVIINLLNIKENSKIVRTKIKRSWYSEKCSPSFIYKAIKSRDRKVANRIRSRIS